MNSKMERHTGLTGTLSIARIAVAALLILLAGLPSSAQVFSSGSNGSDGALNLVTPGVIVFDPTVLGLDTDGDHVFHFTTINIGAGVTVRLSTQYLHGPVYWLASGAVTIGATGILDLNGENGYNCANTLPDYSLRRPAVGGAGGFNGGVGGWTAGPAVLTSQDGSGPNGGARAASGSANGANGTLGANLFLIPMTGGSGGGGGHSATAGCFAGGGGAGGGAILIASSVSITVTGTIRANGGSNGLIPGLCCAGGDGSGGAIRLMAPLIQGNGSISASSPAGAASAGRIRLESYQQSFTGSVSPIALLSSPSILATVLPSGPPPSIRVIDVAGVTLPTSPGGTFTVPDATINQDTPATINIEATNIPVGTVLTLHISSESGPDFTVLTTPLAGTLASSTASASAIFPTGFSRGYIRGTWTP